MKQDSTQTILLIVIICVIVILIIGVVLFREKVFTTGKQLGKKTNDELQSMGYGIYSTVYQTPCLTSTGKCSTAGQQYTTQYCVPHSTTGKGCINSDGEQTFAPQTFSQNCLPNCRKYVFTDSTHNFSNLQTTCAYPVPYNSASVNCIPSTIHPYFYNVLTCMNNDNVGDNACSYTCGQDGITNTHISGDSDPTLSSYIPACVSNKGKVITLNSMASSVVDLTNLPANGFNLSKGFNVKNIFYSGTGFIGPSGPTGSSIYYYGPTGSINPNYFAIVPSYNFPKTDTINGGVRNIVNKEDLAFLDQNLIVYRNDCKVTPSKPICGNRYLYPPTQIQGDLTSDTLPIPPVNRGSVFQTQACFVAPFWDSVTGPSGATGSAVYISNFKNPYLPEIVATGPSGGTGSYEGYNPLAGIGLFGITFEPQTCLNIGKFPSLSVVYPDASLIGVSGSTGLTGDVGFPQYVIPASQTFCLPLSESYTGPSNTTCYPHRNYIPTQLLDTNQSYNICNTEFPDGIPPQNQFLSGKTPGTTVNCQYMPPSELLNFTDIEKSIGVSLPSYTKELFGNYIQLQTDFGTTQPRYFLSGKTTPCQLGLTDPGLLPLTNCTPYSNVNQGYSPLELMLVQKSNQYGDLNNTYDASAFWSKPGCENEMITYTSSLNLIISPIKIEFNLPSDPPTITCYLFGFMGNVFGMLFFDPTNNGRLYFQPISQENAFDKNYYLGIAANTTFVIRSYPNQIGIKGLQFPSTLVPLNTATYDGQDYNTTPFTSRSPPLINPFSLDDILYKTYPFEGPIIINGKDVTLTANLQRNNSCYYDTCNPGPTGTVCYPNTCNLFYDYNPEIC